MIFKCSDLVSFISTNMTLLPGDIILTGTPSGIGPIESNDTLEVRIQGLAPLVNSVSSRCGFDSTSLSFSCSLGSADQPVGESI